MVMETIAEKDLGGVGDLTILADADEKVDLLAGFSFRIIPDEVFRQTRSIDHDGGLLNWAGPEKHVEDLF